MLTYCISPPVTSKILHLPSSLVGVAGTDYSTYASVPATGFECKVQEFPGIYSDTEAECQVTELMIIKIIYYWISHWWLYLISFYKYLCHTGLSHVPTKWKCWQLPLPQWNYVQPTILCLWLVVQCRLPSSTQFLSS